MTETRFKVAPVTEWPIDGRLSKDTRRCTSYSVLDSGICYHECARFVPRRGYSQAMAERDAFACAAALELGEVPARRKPTAFCPTCPKCGDVGTPRARVCGSCGARLV